MIQAKYTEVLYNLINNPRVKQVIDYKMSTYPLYVSTSQHIYHIPNIIPTREELNSKILNYYKYREIGFETVGRFLDELEIALKEIMPKYNQLFFSADQDYNIIFNVDYQKTINRDTTGNTSNTSNGSANGTSTSDSNNKNISSDTPQSQLNISDINNVDYANNVTWDKATGTDVTSSTSTASATGQNNEVESIIETTKGNFGVVSAQDLIKKYRELIINIEQEIINDPRIKELFMLIY